MDSITESLKQDKYSLKKEIELKNQMLQSIESEYENAIQQQKSFIEQLERRHNREISEFNNELKKLRAELDDSRINEELLKNKLNYQMELLTNQSKEKHILSDRAHESFSSEMLSLQLQKAELENKKASLEAEVNELRCQQQQLELGNSNLTLQLECLQKEKDEKENEALSYFSTLEEVREKNRALKNQLDEVQLEALKPNKKGNSLFSEVEDRRLKLERQLKNMKVQYQSVQKQLAFSIQECQRMKLQIASLLRMKSSQANREQLERLQSMVVQKNSEIEDLTVRVQHLEKCRLNQEQNNLLNFSNGDETYYVDLLKMKLEQSIKENEKLKDELSLQRMKALAESQQVLELERKLFTNDEQHKHLQWENMQLRVTLDELKMKYEPAEMAKMSIQKRRIEVYPVVLPSELVYDACALPAESSQKTEELKPGIKTSGEITAATPIEDSSPLEVQANVSLPLNPEEIEPLPKKKRAQILEERNNMQVVNERNGDPPRLTPAGSKSLAEKQEAQKEFSFPKCERRFNELGQKILYIPSKPTGETQCPQQ